MKHIEEELNSTVKPDHIPVKRHLKTNGMQENVDGTISKINPKERYSYKSKSVVPPNYSLPRKYIDFFKEENFG